MAAVYGFKHHLVTRARRLDRRDPAGAARSVGIFVAIGRYLVEEQDEYLRVLMVRQTLWASGFALSIATIWGFLESFELVGHVESFYVAVLWFGGLGLGACANKLDHRAAANEQPPPVLRAERNWSQGDLAAALDVSRQSVNAIETGRYDPSLPLAFKIAELFALTIEDVFTSPSKET